MADNKTLRRIIMLVIVAIAIFAYLDLTPSFTGSREGVIRWMWYFAIAGIAYSYYIYKKDKSEAMAVFSVGMISLFSGMEDLFYFIIQKIQGTIVNTCVNPDLDNLATYMIGDNLLGNTCVTFNGLFLNVLLGLGVSYLVYKYLVEV